MLHYTDVPRLVAVCACAVLGVMMLIAADEDGRSSRLLYPVELAVEGRDVWKHDRSWPCVWAGLGSAVILLALPFGDRQKEGALAPAITTAGVIMAWVGLAPLCGLQDLGHLLAGACTLAAVSAVWKSRMTLFSRGIWFALASVPHVVALVSLGDEALWPDDSRPPHSVTVMIYVIMLATYAVHVMRPQVATARDDSEVTERFAQEVKLQSGYASVVLALLLCAAIVLVAAPGPAQRRTYAIMRWPSDADSGRSVNMAPRWEIILALAVPLLFRFVQAVVAYDMTRRQASTRQAQARWMAWTSAVHDSLCTGITALKLCHACGVQDGPLTVLVAAALAGIAMLRGLEARLHTFTRLQGGPLLAQSRRLRPLAALRKRLAAVPVPSGAVLAVAMYALLLVKLHGGDNHARRDTATAAVAAAMAFDVAVDALLHYNRRAWRTYLLVARQATLVTLCWLSFYNKADAESAALAAELHRLS